VQLVSKNSNLCGPDPPTLQTDGQTDRRTDDMRSQYRALHQSASRGKKQYWIQENRIRALNKDGDSKVLRAARHTEIGELKF